MESGLFVKQRTIQTKSNILWTVQLTRNIPMDDDKYTLRATIWRKPCKLHGWLCNLGEDKRRTKKTHNQVPKDSRETQPMFQTVKMQFQHHRSTHIRSIGWKWRSTNRRKKGQSVERKTNSKGRVVLGYNSWG